MEIVWRRSALNDLEALREFIAQDNPRAAARIYAAIQAAVERLAAYPNLGRAGRVEGTRELIPNPVDRNLCCGCHCERSEAISSGNAHPDRDCFVAPLLAMTGRAWIL
ncbi:MAG TPA: type II toxin-antitoxin system RelE/ParE family toxin, partial [Stellaceae bacterium]|nr:type II toxin-antitoxin system RelE/ParE family toxin [Stellaceae bacterium]